MVAMMKKVIALPWKGGYSVPRRENPALEDSWFRPNGWNRIDDFNLANLALGDSLPKGKYAERK